jgi:hypothetical protein
MPILPILLRGISTAAQAQPAQPQHPPGSWAVDATAAYCLEKLVQLAYWRARDKPAPGALPAALPTAVAATELAHQLINGGGGGSCSCRLGSGAATSAAAGARVPILSFSRANHPMAVAHIGEGSASTMMHTGSMLLSIFSFLPAVQAVASRGPGSPEARQLDSKGAYLLQLQDLASCLVEHRLLGAPGGRGSGGGSGARGSAAVPSCANVAAFLGDVPPAALAVQRHDPHTAPTSLAQRAHNMVAALSMPLLEPNPQVCQRCLPEQLLLLVEATCMYPKRALELIGTHGGVLRLVHGMVMGWMDVGGDAWGGDFMARAAPTLAAWVPAAARQLPTSPPAAGADATAAAQLAAAVLQATSMLMLAPSLQPPARRGRQLRLDPPALLAAAERALRASPAAGRQSLAAAEEPQQDVRLGAMILQVCGRCLTAGLQRAL